MSRLEPPDVGLNRSVGTEPRATSAKTDRQQRQNSNGSRDKRQPYELLTAPLPDDLNRLTAVQQKNFDAPA